MVGIAKAMGARVSEIRLPEIVNRSSLEIGKYVHIIHGIATACGMNVIVG
jgi:hypothetical protein